MNLRACRRMKDYSERYHTAIGTDLLSIDEDSLLFSKPLLGIYGEYACPLEAVWLAALRGSNGSSVLLCATRACRSFRETSPARS